MLRAFTVHRALASAMPSSRIRRLLTALTALASCPAAPGLQVEDEAVETIVVIGVTPTDTRGLPEAKIPAHVRRATSEELDRQLSADLALFLSSNFGSVFLNDAQSNPLQPDVQFRGFVASPLLGLPQGLSVYQDGVRINEPFGDTLNWALIPEQAIGEIRLVPGSNPLYGLNTLGGSLAIETKNGFTHPGSRAELRGGSFERLLAQAESGGRIGERSAYYVTASHVEEDGWRDYSPTRATSAFANLSHHTVASQLDLSLTHVDTRLVGNGAAPVELLEIDREAVFTRPDQTQNLLSMLSLRGRHELGPDLALSGVVYLRDSDVDTLNGDDSDFEECEDLPGLLCQEEADGEETVVTDTSGLPIPFSEAVEGATQNRSSTRQEAYGTTVQAHLSARSGEVRHDVIGGLSFDASRVDFAASTELGTLDDTRRATGSGVIVGESLTRLVSRTRNFSVYLTDTLTLTPAVSATVSARYNRTEIELDDELGTALNGDHEFDRLNPAVGMTWRLRPDLQLYGSYSESSRAPSPVELTCADEDDPCRLPNAFLSDPPLEQVVARSVELGARGSWSNIAWHAGLFHTVNSNDIIFVSAGALTNQGFFENVGDTRRRGLEIDLELADEAAEWRWHLTYTWLDVTFEERFSVPSPNHPAAVDGEIPIEPGDRIPGIPEHLLKLGGTFSPRPDVMLGAEINLSSERHLRGDEGNLLDAVSGYALTSCWGSYTFNEHLSLFARIDNLFDEAYATFGLLGAAGEVLGDEFEDPRFLSPGAPRSFWIGVRLAL